PDERTQLVEHLANRATHAAGNVVRLARGALFQQETVGPHDVVHVREVAHRLQVSHLQPRRADATPNLPELPRKRGRHEVRRLPPSLRRASSTCTVPIRFTAKARDGSAWLCSTELKPAR